jgi:DNA repair exonuclease SbcCD ATPase subunit
MRITKLLAKNVFKYDIVTMEFKDDIYLILASTRDTKINELTGLPEEYDNYEKSNGVGKSAIIELIMYALFGKTLRDISDISKYHTGKFYVELQFDDNKKIIRTDKGIEIWNGDIKIIYKKTDGQKIIDSMINLDFDMLQFTNIFTPENNFFKLDDGEKKDILMKLINVDYIDNAYEKVKKDSDLLKEKKLDNVISIYEDEVKRLPEIMQQEVKAREELAEVCTYEKGILKWADFNKTLNNYLLNYKELYQDTKSLSLRLKELNVLKDTIKYSDIQELYTKQSEINSKITVANNKISENRQHINNIGNHSVCPTCELPLTDEHRKSVIDKWNKVISDNQMVILVDKNELNIIDKEILDNRKLKERHDNVMADFQSGVKIFNQNKELLKSKRSVIKEYVSLNKEAYQYKNIKIAMQDIRMKQIAHAEALAQAKGLMDKKDKLDEFKKANIQLNKDINDLELIKKFFSKDGLKQFAVSKVISFLEVEINNMLSTRFNDLSIKIITSFDVGRRNSMKIKVMRGTNEVELNEFSAGEKRFFEIIFNISLCKLFNLFSNQRFNIMFFDEAFDAIDQFNSPLAIEIINLLKEDNNSIFVVSHRDYIKEFFDKQIHVSADLLNKNSKMEEN